MFHLTPVTRIVRTRLSFTKPQQRVRPRDEQRRDRKQRNENDAALWAMRGSIQSPDVCFLPALNLDVGARPTGNAVRQSWPD